MLHPVGSQPPSVYWRRRLLVLASVVVLLLLLVLTARAMLPGGDPKPAAHSSTTHSSHTQPSPTPAHSTATSTAATTTATHTSTPPRSSAAPPPCRPTELKLQAVVGKPAYRVGDQPVLTLQVTNGGSALCVQNVADSQIELRVYNGASRVWGSHDCQIEPGVDERTLAPGKPAGFSIVWSGLTSTPGCTKTRQRVGAGTYTLYASLAGRDGAAAQFTIS